MAATCVVAMGGAAACSQDFSGDDCKETRTCAVEEDSIGGEAGSPAASDSDGGTAVAEGGSAGAFASDGEGGASAGAAGQAGGEPAAECSQASDCSDGLACNGAEECDETGHCAPGAPPVCANTDAVHCSAKCMEADGFYECEVEAIDADEDGHGTALCSAQKGDDCDDAQKTVFTGADELCDRVDNDCDGKIDLADGLAFAGVEHKVGRDLDETVDSERAALAWSESAKLYGLFYRVTNSDNLFFVAYDAQGARQAGPVNVGQYAYGTLAIAEGAGGFGVVWTTDAGLALFRTVDKAGKLSSAVTLTGREGSGSLALAWLPSTKTWGIVSDHGVATVDAKGVASNFVHKFNKALIISSVQIVAAGTKFVVGLSAELDQPTGPNLPDPRVSRFDSSFTTLEPLAFANPSKTSSVELAARADGSFGVSLPGSLEAPASQLALFDAAGKLACQTSSAPDRATGITASAAGYAIAFRAAPGKISFREASASCVMGSIVPAPFLGAYALTLTASATSYGALWHGDSANSWSYSIFGSNFCN